MSGPRGVRVAETRKTEGTEKQCPDLFAAPPLLPPQGYHRDALVDTGIFCSAHVSPPLMDATPKLPGLTVHNHRNPQGVPSRAAWSARTAEYPCGCNGSATVSKAASGWAGNGPSRVEGGNGCPRHASRGVPFSMAAMI